MGGVGVCGGFGVGAGVGLAGMGWVHGGRCARGFGASVVPGYLDGFLAGLGEGEGSSRGVLVSCVWGKGGIEIVSYLPKCSLAFARSNSMRDTRVARAAFWTRGFGFVVGAYGFLRGVGGG